MSGRLLLITHHSSLITSFPLTLRRARGYHPPKFFASNRKPFAVSRRSRPEGLGHPLRGAFGCSSASVFSARMEEISVRRICVLVKPYPPAALKTLLLLSERR